MDGTWASTGRRLVPLHRAKQNPPCSPQTDDLNPEPAAGLAKTPQKRAPRPVAFHGERPGRAPSPAPGKSPGPRLLEEPRPGYCEALPHLAGTGTGTGTRPRPRP